jgi:hypothetical protein
MLIGMLLLFWFPEIATWLPAWRFNRRRRGKAWAPPRRLRRYSRCSWRRECLQ